MALGKVIFPDRECWPRVYNWFPEETERFDRIRYYIVDFGEGVRLRCARDDSSWKVMYQKVENDWRPLGHWKPNRPALYQ